MLKLSRNAVQIEALLKRINDENLKTKQVLENIQKTTTSATPSAESSPKEDPKVGSSHWVEIILKILTRVNQMFCTLVVHTGVAPEFCLKTNPMRRHTFYVL